MSVGRSLYSAAIAGGLIIAGLLFGRLLLTPATGDVALMVASGQPDHFETTDLAMHSPVHGWQELGRVRSIAVPAAPSTKRALEVRLPVGTYDAIRIGTQRLPARIYVDRTTLTVVLIAVKGGRPVPDGVYAGSENVSLGLNELAGNLKSMPTFSLIDQFGRPFSNASISGHDVVLASFHTTCRESCPLMTGLFLQLRQKLPPTTLLIEATTDPQGDAPAVLKAYAGSLGASWTFLTGDPVAMASFWKPFGVELSSSDAHRSVLALIDSHGYLRSYFLGAPDIGSSLASPLQQQLDEQGRKLQSSHGSDWGESQVLDVVRTIGGLASPSSSGQGQALDFTLKTLEGKSVSLSDYRGRPVLINFWATYCAPCRREMPMLDGIVKSHPNLSLLLVDERDDPGAARAFVTQLQLRSTVLLDGDGQVGDRYSVSGLPTTIFVRADGSVEGRYLGETNQQLLAPHLAAIGA